MRDRDHVMEQQWRNGLGRPDRLCGRRFDPERTFFTNQDKIIVSAPGFESHAFCALPIGLDSPVAPGFDSRTGNAHPDWIGTRVRFPLDPPPILSNPIGK